MANVGIVSIGEMGAGIARLLIAHNFRVLTNVSDRSEATKSRARNAGIQLLPTDTDLVTQADYILSIVPPRDAKATAQRIVTAFKALSPSPTTPPWYLDLNAIAPSTARSIAALFPPSIPFIDGGIIGGPPKPDPKPDDGKHWSCPSICLSGPHPLPTAPRAGDLLARTLNTRHVGDEVGTASGLKCCFASLTKGYTALAIQSFSTAARMGVLPDLRDYIGTHGGAARLAMTERSLVAMPPKAGRWVEEMREIGRTFGEDGGWGEGEGIFEQVAGVYEFVSEGTELGREQGEKRVRGTTVDDLVEVLGEGLERRKEKMD